MPALHSQKKQTLLQSQLQQRQAITPINPYRSTKAALYRGKVLAQALTAADRASMQQPLRWATRPCLLTLRVMCAVVITVCRLDSVCPWMAQSRKCARTLCAGN